MFTVDAPSVRPLKDRNISAGLDLEVECPVTKGNPPATTFEWTRNDSKTWSSEILDLKNVSKDDDMIYTCTVNNTMKPTGASKQHGHGSGSFHLNVLCKLIYFFIYPPDKIHEITS